MNKIIIQNFNSPFGDLLLGSFQDQLCVCDWRHRKMRLQIDARIQKGLNAEYEEGKSGTIDQAISMLKAYFSGDIMEYNMKLLFVGTAFQQGVWNELIKIPYGKTETYLGLSRRLGNEKSIRAVAAANGANALSIFVPCHRIIGSNGDLTGYAGGIKVKEKLLQLESAKINIQAVQGRLFK